MTILDVNILLYACDADAPENPAARKWLQRLFAGPEVIGFPWITVWGFLRICTNQRALRNGITPTSTLVVSRTFDGLIL